LIWKTKVASSGTTHELQAQGPLNIVILDGEDEDNKLWHNTQTTSSFVMMLPKTMSNLQKLHDCGKG
jgi:hypothetical protein